MMIEIDAPELVRMILRAYAVGYKEGRLSKRR